MNMFKQILEVFTLRPQFQHVFILDNKRFSFSEDHVQKHAHWYKKIEKLTPEQVAAKALEAENKKTPPAKKQPVNATIK